MENIRVAAVQFEPVPGEKEVNLNTIRRFTRQAAEQNVRLLVFPECCVTGYWFLRKLSKEQISALSEPAFTGPTAGVLLNLAQTYGLTLGAGLVEASRDGRFYNTYLVAMPDGNLQRHRKLHSFESEHISSGSEYTVFDTPHRCRVGVLTCYDVNIFENVRITASWGPMCCSPRTRPAA